METKFGRVKHSGWHGIKINYQEEIDDFKVNMS